MLSLRRLLILFYLLHCLQAWSLSGFFKNLFGKKSSSPTTVPEELKIEHYPLPTKEAPLYAKFDGKPKVGQTLHINGTFEYGTLELCFNFTTPANKVLVRVCSSNKAIEGSPIKNAVHYEAIFKNGTILRDHVPNPLKDFAQFDFRVRVLRKNIQVFANRGEIGIFQKPDTFDEVTNASVYGELSSLAFFRVYGAEYPLPAKKELYFNAGDRVDISAQPIPNVNDPKLIRELFGVNNTGSTNGSASAGSATAPPLATINITELLTKLANPSPTVVTTAAPITDDFFNKHLKGQYNVSSIDELTKRLQDGSLKLSEVRDDVVHLRAKRRSSHSRRGSFFGSHGIFGGSSSSSSSKSSDRKANSRSWWKSSSGDRGQSESRKKSSAWSSNRSVFKPKKSSHFSAPSAPTAWRPSTSFSAATGFAAGAGTGYYAQSYVPSFSYRYGGSTYYYPSCYSCGYHSCYTCGSHYHRSYASKKYSPPPYVPHSKRFDITFLSASGLPKFILSFRFDEGKGVVVRNSFRDGKWQSEERDGGMPIDNWRLFDMALLNSAEDVAIYFQGRRFAAFQHRDETRDFAKILIDGDLEVHKIEKNGATVN